MKELFSFLRVVYRLFIFIVLISGFLGWSFLCHWFIRDPDKRRSQFTRNSKFTSGLILNAFGVNVNIINKPADDEKFLVVSNHMGFVDILLLCSIFPTVFVTSLEMRETPFLGLLTEMGGCVYVERRSRDNIQVELKSLILGLQKGLRILLYPEATSTNGEKVLPFKRTLMTAAAYAGVPIQPVVVNFKEINGDKFILKWRDHVCWYGDIPFAVALWNVLSLKSLTAEVEFLEKIYPTPEDDRGVIADKAHALIAEKFIPVSAT